MDKAFTYMFKDNKFAQKAAIIFIFAIITNLFYDFGDKNTLISKIFSLLGTIISFVPTGYMVSCTKALIEQKENFILPVFNFKSNFVIGFKYNIAFWILTLLAGLVFVCALLVFLLPLGIFKAQMGPVLMAPAICIIYSLIVLLALVIFIGLAFYGVAFGWIFANTQSLTSFLQFKKAHMLIKNNWKRYLDTILDYVLIIVITLCAFAIYKFGKSIFPAIIATIFSAALGTYITFVSAMLTAKAIVVQDK